MQQRTPGARKTRARARRPGIRKRLEEKLESRAAKKYTLHLYVAGLTPRSQKAIENIRNFCRENMPGKFKLSIHDIYKRPFVAKNGQILAAPTLVKELPPPLRKFVGDMSNTEKLLVGLDLRSK